MFHTEDKILNPVIAWAKTVRQVQAYSHASMYSKVCSFVNNQGQTNLKADHVRIWL
jgi:hypothetical protein